MTAQRSQLEAAAAEREALLAQVSSELARAKQAVAEDTLRAQLAQAQLQAAEQAAAGAKVRGKGCGCRGPGFGQA